MTQREEKKQHTFVCLLAAGEIEGSNPTGIRGRKPDSSTVGLISFNLGKKESRRVNELKVYKSTSGQGRFQSYLSSVWIFPCLAALLKE